MLDGGLDPHTEGTAERSTVQGHALNFSCPEIDMPKLKVTNVMGQHAAMRPDRRLAVTMTTCSCVIVGDCDLQTSTANDTAMASRRNNVKKYRTRMKS